MCWTAVCLAAQRGAGLYMVLADCQAPLSEEVRPAVCLSVPMPSQGHSLPLCVRFSGGCCRVGVCGQAPAHNKAGNVGCHKQFHCCMTQENEFLLV